MALVEGTASLEKAFRVLRLIGSAPSGIGNNALLEQSGFPKTTLYRILGTLIEYGLVRRDGVRRVYRLGFGYLEMVRNAYLMPDLVVAASAELHSLRDLTGETAYLAVLEGSSVLSLERCDGAHPHRSAAALGQSKPLHCTGQGKAILSRLPKHERDTLLKAIDLVALTPHTITDRRRLQAEIGICAARGYAIDDEEIVLGIRCVAAPIVDGAGKVRGAISVAGPAYRLSRERVELLGPELASAAHRVGAQMAVTRPANETEAVETVGDTWAFHGAFPVWHPSRRCLYWADTLAPAIHRYDGHTDVIVARVESPITCLQLYEDRILVIHGTQLSAMDAHHVLRESTRPRTWTDAETKVLCVDARGVAWAAWRSGKNHVGIGPLSTDGRGEPMWRVDEAVCAIAWTADQRTAYAAGPASGTIYVLQAGARQVRRLTTFPQGSGRIAALALDAAGGIWVALAAGWSVVRLSAEGALDRVVSLPVATPTGLAFGEDGNGEPVLYVTTDRHDQSIESLSGAPWSGRLLQVRLSTTAVHNSGGEFANASTGHGLDGIVAIETNAKRAVLIASNKTGT